LEEAGDRLPIISGVYADGSHQAANIAQMAAKQGTSALLVFPPNSMSMGGHLKPDMAMAHFQHIADATDLPLILFQYPMGSGLGYPFDTLMRLIDEVPHIRAVKDWCNDPMLHERHIWALQGHSRPVNVLTTHSGWLIASLVMGCKGLLSGAGSVIADLQIALWRSVLRRDLTAAQAINQRMHPVVQAFYAPPFLDMHNRMKEALVILGRQQQAVVRPPLTPITAHERERLRAAFAEARITAEGSVGLAA
jgi:4-hydroxy-tetrahydrodipicolinate synthase